MKTKFIYLITFSIISILLSSTGCMKKTNLEDSNLGEPVSADKIQNEMSSGIGEVDPSTINLNESSTITASVTYQNTQTVPMFSQKLVVGAVSATPTSVFLGLYASKVDNLGSNSYTNETVILESPLVINTVSDFHLYKDESKNISVTLPFANYVLFMENCKSDQKPCYNFTTTQTQIKWPTSKADTRICEDVNNCLMDARRVEFDYLNYNDIQSNGKPNRMHVNFLIAKKMPYLSRVVSMCIRSLLPYNDKKILADECYYVDSFAVGDQAK